MDATAMTDMNEVILKSGRRGHLRCAARGQLPDLGF
jgi:hypothetical protein